MDELNIGKLIKKVMIYTLVSLVTLCLLVVTLWGLISPGSLSDACSKISLESASLYLQRAEYERSDNDINELSALYDKAIFAGNDDFVIKYGEKYIEHENFDEYCDFCDEQMKNDIANVVFYQREFVTGNYIKVFYKRNTLENTFEKAYGFFSGTYSGWNPVSVFIGLYVGQNRFAGNSVLSDEINSKLKEILITVENLEVNGGGAISEEQIKAFRKNICIDGYMLASATGNVAESDFWNDKYKEI